MGKVQIHVHSYKNYRFFLKDYYEFQKAVDPKFSYREFSKKAGLHSPNYLQLVISGKRNLTVENIHQFSQAMSLTPGELDYFEPLVLANQSKDPVQISYYNRKLKALSGKKRSGVAKSNTPELLDQWCFLGIIAVLAGRKEGVFVEEIRRLTGLSEDEVVSVIARIQKNGIVSEKDHRYFLNEKEFVYYYKSKISDRFKRFQETQLQRSLLALKTQAETEAKFFSHVFTIEKKHQKFCHEKIRTFLSELSAETNEDKPEKLLQLNIQLFSFAEAAVTSN